MFAKQPLRAGYQLQSYTLLEELGRGGEAIVWSGWDRFHRRVVALKLIPTEGTQPSLISADFDRQVHLIASLGHPNILPLYEFNSTSDHYYFAMRYASGGTVTDLLQQGPLPLEQTLCLAADIVAALEYLHSNRIVHRDLKPSNILLDAQGRAYLTDFGLARRLTEDTLPLHTGRGTTYYASPEQHSRSILTPRSDIYSLGIVLYEMLTGNLPERDEAGDLDLTGGTTLELPAFDGLRGEVLTPLLGKLQRLTAYDPFDRPETARQAYDLLFGDLPAEVAERVRKSRAERRLLVDEGELLADDARTLLARVLDGWQPDEPYPASLTQFAFIDSAYSGLDGGQEPPEGALDFLLHGALLHGHNQAHWWQRAADKDVRLRVGERLITGDEQEAIERVLSQMADAPPDALPYRDLSSAAIHRLVDLATRGGASALRSNALVLLRRAVTPADRWQPTAFSVEADTKLGQLAARESPFAQQAARLIGEAHSEQGLRALLEEARQGRNEALILAALQEVREAAHGLPSWTPLAVRVRSTLDRIRRQFLEDPAVLSWSRALIGLLTAALVSTLMVLGIFSRPNNQMHDILYEPYPVSDVVTIVEVNDEALERYGRWSNWPRSLHADLIDELSRAGADSIVLDFTFVSETDDDEELARAMRRAGNVVQPILGQGDAYLSSAGLLEFRSSLLPRPELVEASAAVGHTNFRHDEDGYVRRLPVVALLGDEEVPNLALAAIQVYLGQEAEGAFAPGQPALDGRTFEFAGRQIPVNDWGEMLVHFAGPPARDGASSYTMVSYQDVLDGDVPASVFEDKIVLVGITATAEPDRYLTAVSDNGRPMYGVEILANAVETIWSGRFIVQPALGVRIAILLALGAAVALLCTRPWLGLVASILAGVAYFILASWLFDFRGVMLDLFFPFLTIALTLVLVTSYRFWVENRERQAILGLFEARVTPRVAQAALTAVRQGDINLGGQEQEVSVLAVDLHGYTAFAARNTPEEVLDMLNTFFDLIVETVFEYEGTITQYASERVVVVFNAPLEQADHALLAVRSAWECRRRMTDYHNSLPDDHPHQLVAFSFGVATGKAVVGYMRTGVRYTYTAMGETVALAARLSAAAAPGEVLVGGAAFRSARGRVTGELLNPVTSRRIAEPTPVYSMKSFNVNKM